jgi:hypothetical protein
LEQQSIKHPRLFLPIIMILLTFQINGKKIQIKLKTTNWRQQIDREMRLCTGNTGALFNTISNSLLGEDFTGLYDFDSDGIFIYSLVLNR